MGVLNAAFDINENRGKEGGQARVDGSQYKTLHALVLGTVGETRTAKLNIALHWQEAESPIPE